MKRSIFLLLILLMSGNGLMAQDLSAYLKKHLVVAGDTLSYRLLLPLDYTPEKSYPLILFLHGAGERGNDNESQLIHGGKWFLQPENRKDFPAIVVFPQCASGSYWSNVDFNIDSVAKRISFLFPIDGQPTKDMAMVMLLMDTMEKNYRIDSERIYVGGLSMGGMGAFEIVRRLPHTFAAAFAICGGANPATAANMKHTAWWIFHGWMDNVVNPKYSIAMAKALRKADAEVLLTIFPMANHNSWDAAFAEERLLPWLWEHRLGEKN